MEYELFLIYKGWGLWPIYLKKIGLFSGLSYLKTKQISLSEEGMEMLGGKLLSGHVGLGADLTLFYRVDSRLEVFYSKILSSLPQKVSQIGITLRAKVFSF